MRGSDKGCRKPEVTITSTFVADSAPRVTRRLRSVNPLMRSRLSPLTNSANGAPASTSAPNVMSPLMPEKQSKCRCTPTSSLSSQAEQASSRPQKPRHLTQRALRTAIAHRCIDSLNALCYPHCDKSAPPARCDRKATRHQDVGNVNLYAIQAHTLPWHRCVPRM